MTNLFGSLAQDLRYGVRNLLRNPGFALVAMLTLALGIGANTTIFSIINDTLLKPIAYPDPARLVLIWETFGKDPNSLNIVSNPNFQDFRRRAKSFESMAIFDSAGRGYSLSSTNQKDAERVSGLRVTASFFDVLGVKPLMGRTFTADEEVLGKDHEVVLSYGLWQDHYAADPSIIGRQTRIDGQDFTVIGVMPREFTWQFWSAPRKLWVPVGYTKTDLGRDNNSFISIARLKSGVSMEQAKLEMQSVAAQIQAENPQVDANMGATINSLQEFGMKDVRSTLYTLFAAVGFVMLIACVNVANLLLARGAARQKEFAVRRALGAAGIRIARQMMTESVLLAIAGGLVGLGLAAASTKLVTVAFGVDKLNLPLRPVDAIHLDTNVFLFALAASCLTGLIFGLAPAFSALRSGLNDTLKEGGRTGGGAKNRVRHALVAAEVALALVVLCGAGLMIKSMSRLLGVDPGFDSKNVLVMGMTVPQEEIYVGPPGLPRFCSDLEEHVGTMPGILSVSAIAHLPMSGNAGRGFQIEGRPPAEPGKMPGASYTVACPNYFRTMGIPVLKGREFNDRDTATSPGVIVINESLKKAFWPNEDPIGTAVHLGGVDGPRLTIVGIVRDVRFQGLDNGPRRQFFRPYQQAGWPSLAIVVKTSSLTGPFVQPIKKTLGDTFIDRPISRTITMREIVESSVGSRRFPMLLLSVFSALALVLAAVGIVGVVGHSVTQRTQEIGLRMALGARSIDVLRLMIGGNMIWVLGGLAIGVAGSLALTRLLTGLLFQVQSFDPIVIGGVAALLAAVALLASYIPARRAARIDPLSALRCE
jgi:predicted permease